MPRRNSEFWKAKFAANVERDRVALMELRARGYHVLTLWECETAHLTDLTRRLLKFRHRFEAA